MSSDRSDDRLLLSLKDNWVIGNASELSATLETLDFSDVQEVIFQCGGLRDFDITGAWVLYRKAQLLSAEGRRTDFSGFKAEHFKFLESVTHAQLLSSEGPRRQRSDLSERLTDGLRAAGHVAKSRVRDFGEIAVAIVDGTRRPSSLVVHETLRHIQDTGIKAVPVVVLVSFLMGLVLAYQGGQQLEKFGATVFVVDLVSISILREMGVLLAAIVVAGRSGSAFAASLGAMKLSQEIDALRTMGINPNQVLVVPRMVALMISLPILALLSNFAGLTGGMALSSLAFGINPIFYFSRVIESASSEILLVGLRQITCVCAADRSSRFTTRSSGSSIRG